MSAPQAPRRALPASPSIEHLKKQAKRLAKDEKLKLSAAQHRLARDYGFAKWAELMRAAARSLSPLAQAAATADDAAVAALLAAGANVDGEASDDASPLFLVCDSNAPADRKLAVATRLLDAGAFPRRGNPPDGATPLHAAARRGPAALVELLMKRGALCWQGDAKGRCPHDYASDGTPIDRERILFLTSDGPKIEDAQFREAVSAIHKGDIAALGALLDARPALLTERAIEPDIGQRGYFSDPKLFWFVANNPTLIPQSPPNIVEIAQAMIARGVAREDVDYTLELTMTNGMMPANQQIALTAALIDAGATANRNALMMTLGHEQRNVVAWLVDRGMSLDAMVAAGLGRLDRLASLLDAANDTERAEALAMAVINRQTEAVRVCLAAGADPNRFMPVHTHSTPLHQAALNGDLAIMKLLLASGARPDVIDTLWHGTPLGWALHGKQEAAAAYLRALPSA